MCFSFGPAEFTDTTVYSGIGFRPGKRPSGDWVVNVKDALAGKTDKVRRTLLKA